jgi:Tol biopolymer transport system component
LKFLPVVILMAGLVPAASGQPILVSRTPASQPGNGISISAVPSADGRFVAFTSTASDLVAGDDVNVDLFRFERDTGTVVRANLPRTPRSSIALFAGGISADGRYTAFESTDGTLVPGDTNGVHDVFLYDWQTGTVTLISRAPGGAVGDDFSAGPQMSADGNRVVFSTRARNFSPLDNGTAEDVFLWDRGTGALTLISRGIDGSAANGFSVFGQINPSGTLVAFSSAATNLTSRPDQNGNRDIYVYHVASGRTVRASVTASGAEPDGECINGVPSDDWTVIFHCSASTLVPGDTNGTGDVYLKDLVSGQIRRVNVRPGGLQSPVDAGFAPLGISSAGTRVAFASSDGALAGGSTSGTFVRLLGSGGTALAAPVAAEMSADGRYVTYSFNATAGALQVLLAPLDLPADTPTTDDDGDGLPTAWESRAGLDPGASTVDQGAAGDPDGDGQTNTQELAAGTHPRGDFTSYLAEGASGSFFTTRLAVANVDTSAASVLLRFLEGDGTTTSRWLTVPGQSRRTITSSNVPELHGSSFATVVESDKRVVVDRLMTWSDLQYGSHAETAIAQPRLRWYLAEGATHSDFALFYLLQNANPQAAAVRVTYLRPAGLPPLIKDYEVPAGSRFNIWVNIEEFPGQGTALSAIDVSAVLEVTNGVPIIVERAMYLSRPGQQFVAGHASAAVADTATEWFLAEGATGSYFDLFVLIANPSTVAAPIDVRYLLADGRTFTKRHIVPAAGRYNIWVDQEEIDGVKPLVDVAVSTTIRSVNDVPLIVERAMWWPGPTAATWHEAHNSPGATQTGTAWALAEGEVGGVVNAETYVLIANTSATAGEARVSVFSEDGSPAQVRTFPLLANSRTNVSVRDEFPATAGKRFAALIESVGSTPAALVVERALYSDTATASPRFPAATALTCAVEATVASTSGSLYELQVVNNTGSTVDVYWKNYTGQRVKYATVTAGSSWSNGSYEGNVWSIIDAGSGACLGVFRVPGAAASALVGVPSQRWAAGSNALATRLQ